MKCEDKYAPTNLNEVIYPTQAVERRIKAYAAGQLEGHVMLYGPNGTGKTTVANLLVTCSLLAVPTEWHKVRQPLENDGHEEDEIHR